MMVTMQLKIMTMQEASLTPHQEDLWRSLFLESPERITQYFPRFLTPPSPVMAKWRADTTLILRQSAKFSTFALTTALAVCPPTPSSVPTAPSSTRTTSSVTGGSTLTVAKLKISTLSMMTLLLKELRLMLLLLIL